jgi:sortase (surface protein transpeptidase)
MQVIYQSHYMCMYLFTIVFVYLIIVGTLDGFLFDSDEEAEKATEANKKDKNNGNGDQPTSKKAKRKNEKSPVCFLHMTFWLFI